jgi:hypothetical protein
MSSTAKAIEALHQEDIKFLQSLSGDLKKRLPKLVRTRRALRWPD